MAGLQYVSQRCLTRPGLTKVAPDGCARPAIAAGCRNSKSHDRIQPRSWAVGLATGHAG